MSTPFFTMLKIYFHCCANRCSHCFNTKDAGDTNNANEPDRDTLCTTHVDYNQFTFDDLSNPNTPMTSSSSSSSLESYKTPYLYSYPYKRPQFKPYIGIIPKNYYSD